MRGRFDHRRLTNLRAATASFDANERHLRINFYFDGTSDAVDFSELEEGTLGELLADAWAGIASVGFAVFFDEPSMKRALHDPERLYPRA
jgi:hypothetical protein